METLAQMLAKVEAEKPDVKALALVDMLAFMLV